MDELVFFVILMIVAAILERIQRSAQKKQPPPEPEEGATDSEPAPPGLGQDLQDLIAEELGINLERRPTVKAPPPAESDLEASETRRPEVYMPRPPGPERRRPPRRRRPPPRERERPRVVSLEEEVVRRPSEAVSLEEAALRRPTEAVSLERPRRPEDHERFHERYQVPRPVESHSEFHERYMKPPDRARKPDAGPRLPSRRGWSPVAQAIVWAEILGPPRGLRD